MKKAISMLSKKKPATKEVMTTKNTFKVSSFDEMAIKSVSASAVISYRTVMLTKNKVLCEVSGGDKSLASTGTTQGFALRLPDNFEEEASGQSVVITVCARSKDDAPLDFSICYSTNEVGNSGWQVFTATNEFQSFSFEYNVNPMVEGNGDYIGILPDFEGHGRTLVLFSIEAAVKT